MSWAGISSNQTVSFNNLQDAVSNGIFSQKTTIPSSNEQITKTDADTYVNIDTSYSPYSSKSSNQLVVKSNLTPAVTSTPTNTPTQTPPSTPTPTPTSTPTTFTVSWSFDELNSANGTMQIYLNGTLTVNVSTTQTGSFSYTAGDYISVDIDSLAGKGLTAFVALDVDDSTGTIYTSTNSGVPNTNLSTGNLFPVGNTTVTGESDDF
jgi:hypothetical protein